MNPILKNIGPLENGKVLAPLPHYAQSTDRLDEIILEMAAILHPELFPGYKKKFFLELPDEG